MFVVKWNKDMQQQVSSELYNRDGTNLGSTLLNILSKLKSSLHAGQETCW